MCHECGSCMACVYMSGIHNNTHREKEKEKSSYLQHHRRLLLPVEALVEDGAGAADELAVGLGEAGGADCLMVVWCVFMCVYMYGREEGL